LTLDTNEGNVLATLNPAGGYNKAINNQQRPLVLNPDSRRCARGRAADPAGRPDENDERIKVIQPTF
jgi:hypothetical protein